MEFVINELCKCIEGKLSEKDISFLKFNLLNKHISPKIIVTQRKVIISGYNIHDICIDNNIKFEVEEVFSPFEDEEYLMFLAYSFKLKK